MKVDCPMLKKKEKWKRAMAAMTWSGDEEPGSEYEAETKEVTNLCLMAHEDKDEVCNSNSSQITFNELQDAFDELMSEFKKIRIKNNLLKKLITTLSKENEDLQKENNDLKNQVNLLEEKVKRNVSSNESLKERQILDDKVKYLETNLYKCANEKDKLDAILGKQKCSLDKAGLGFNPHKRKMFSRTKPNSSNKKKQISSYLAKIIGT